MSSSSQKGPASVTAESDDDSNKGESSSETVDGSNVARGEKRKALVSTVGTDAKRLKTQSVIGIYK